MLTESDKTYLKNKLVLLFEKKDYAQAYNELIFAANYERDIPLDMKTEMGGKEMLDKAIPQGSDAIFTVFQTFVDGLISSGAIQTSMILKDFLLKNESLIKQDDKPPTDKPPTDISKGLIFTGSLLLSLVIVNSLGD